MGTSTDPVYLRVLDDLRHRISSGLLEPGARVPSRNAIIARYGARPVLFMSWAYKDVPEMTAQLAEQYTIAGNANDALVIPAGLAFAKAIARRPSLELYQPDLRHPTLAGTYLAACTTYATLRQKSPVGIKIAGSDPAVIDRIAQQVERAVKDVPGVTSALAERFTLYLRIFRGDLVDSGPA